MVILNYLNGKKTIILSGCIMTLAFLQLKGIVDADTCSFIGGILSLILGGTAVAQYNLPVKTPEVIVK